MPSDHLMSDGGSAEAQTSVEGAHAERSRFTQISAWTGGVIGFAALAGGALLTGSSHWAASAKVLREEGVDPKLRLQALPVAAKALGYTSLVALVLGGAAVLTMQHVFDARDVTEVSSLAEAIALAKRQRTAVQQEFAKRIDGSRDDGKPP